jgi:hypothetical protein
MPASKRVISPGDKFCDHAQVREGIAVDRPNPKVRRSGSVTCEAVKGRRRSKPRTVQYDTFLAWAAGAQQS